MTSMNYHVIKSEEDDEDDGLCRSSLPRHQSRQQGRQDSWSGNVKMEAPGTRIVKSESSEASDLSDLSSISSMNLNSEGKDEDEEDKADEGDGADEDCTDRRHHVDKGREDPGSGNLKMEVPGTGAVKSESCEASHLSDLSEISSLESNSEDDKDYEVDEEDGDEGRSRMDLHPEHDKYYAGDEEDGDDEVEEDGDDDHNDSHHQYRPLAAGREDSWSGKVKMEASGMRAVKTESSEASEPEDFRLSRLSNCPTIHQSDSRYSEAGDMQATVDSDFEEEGSAAGGPLLDDATYSESNSWADDCTEYDVQQDGPSHSDPDDLHPGARGHTVAVVGDDPSGITPRAKLKRKRSLPVAEEALGIRAPEVSMLSRKVSKGARFQRPASSRAVAETTTIVEDVAFADDGKVYTEPACMVGVPLQKIKEGDEYWDPTWGSVENRINDQVCKWTQKFTVGKYKAQAKPILKEYIIVQEYLRRCEISPYQLIAKKFYKRNHGSRYGTRKIASNLDFKSLRRMIKAFLMLEARGKDAVPWMRSRLHEIIRDEGDKFDLRITLQKFETDSKFANLPKLAVQKTKQDRLEEAAIKRQAPTIITPENLALRDDGEFYTKPAYLAGVPLAKIEEEGKYWDPSWKRLKDFVRLEEQKQKLEKWPAKAKMARKRCTKVMEMLDKSGTPHPYQLLSKCHYKKNGKAINFTLETLWKLANILDVLERLHLEMGPADWLRGRLGEIIKIEGDDFDLVGTLNNIISDASVVKAIEKRREEAAIERQAPTIITPENLALRDDGEFYTEPAYLAGVPLAKIEEEGKYWDRDWRHLESFVQLQAGKSTDKAKRWEGLATFLREADIHPYQLLAKGYYQKEGKSIDLANFQTLSAFKSVLRVLIRLDLNMKPVDWLRGRLGEIIKIEGDDFDLEDTLNNIMSDASVVKARQGKPCTGESKVREAFQDDGEIYTAPGCMAGVPLKKIKEGGEYWDSSWKYLSEHIQSSELPRWKEKSKLAGATNQFRSNAKHKCRQCIQVQGFLSKCAISPYQLMAKKFYFGKQGVALSVCNLNNLYILASVFSNLERLGKKPEDWFRERLAERYSLEGEDFNLTKTIQDFRHDASYCDLLHEKRRPMEGTED